MAQFQRSEPIHDIHYAYSGPEHIPPHVRNVRISLHCLSDCLVFLLRGIIFIDRQGVLTEPGYAYFVKDEVGLELGGNTTIFVMEEGEMKGICARKLKEKHEKYLAEKESAERKQNRPWNALLAKFRRERPEEQALQCPTQ